MHSNFSGTSKFLRDRKIYEFTCLPFGLCSEPRTSLSSHGILEEAGSAVNHLPGRHTDYAPVQGRLAITGRNDGEIFGVIGLHHQCSSHS